MDLIKFRRDTSDEWSKWDPILEDGEPGLEQDTGKLKFGDGDSHWSELDYFASGAPVPGGGGGGTSDEAVLAHINSINPHPVYDDGPSLLLLYQNAKV